MKRREETTATREDIVTSRRRFFFQSAMSVGAIALCSLLNDNLFAAGPTAADRPLAPRPPHFPAKVKSVIYMFMAGAPSQLDLFEYKPKLTEMDGEKVPESLIEGERFAFLRGVPKLLSTRYKFQRHGKSGVYLSELLPHLAEVVDDITFIRTMHTEQFNHVPAQLFINTGSPRMGRPAMGSWVTYGLGSENKNLPGFVVLASGKAGRCGTVCWGSGFLPTVYQGVQFRSEGDPVLFLSDPPGIDSELRRQSLDTLRDLNQGSLLDIGDPEIATRIASYELAYRMQTSVPELMDISSEPASIREMYGTEPGKISFANNCLLARRMIERGVRFVQLYHGGWDHHGGTGDQNLVTNLPERCEQTDRGAAALVKDLKQRGLLEETLVIWGGEFGRTPMLQGEATPKMLGRDHHRKAYTIWMTGGGIERGISIGSTDELGYNILEGPVHIHDLQATILHLLGLDHTRLTYRFQGRDFRLTDVHGEIIHKLLA
ncbi:MAG: DUF1501 domain-containing protein [Acidobacteriota bacterium]